MFSVRSRSVRSDSVRFGSVRFGSVRFGSVRFGSVRFGSVRLGSIRFDSIRLGSVRSIGPQHGDIDRAMSSREALEVAPGLIQGGRANSARYPLVGRRR